MEWTDAIRKHAAMTGGKYRIPRKGTPEYDAVKKLQMGGGEKADKEHKKMVKEAVKKGEVVKGVYSADAKGVSVKVKGLPSVKVSAKKAPAMKKATHLKFDEEGKEIKKPRKVRSDKGKKRGARKSAVSEEMEE
jgi:hypothetical protein